MRAINQYKKTSVTTANRFEVVVMLYDGFLTFCKGASASMKAGNRAQAGSFIGQAMAIVHELNAALDHREAPELCASLESLYQYLDRLLLNANIRQQPESLEEAVTLMSELREAWAGASRDSVSLREAMK
ncbi:MAG: flagellar export chaperone FliS [Myxococcales bacterium]|nr:flagellar export chaperone FliS [Myxococcales bacterium]